jgi:hypothetical protein
LDATLSNIGYQLKNDPSIVGKLIFEDKTEINDYAARLPRGVLLLDAKVLEVISDALEPLYDFLEAVLAAQVFLDAPCLSLDLVDGAPDLDDFLYPRQVLGFHEVLSREFLLHLVPRLGL